jgi:signal transduction histidine kinase
MMNVLLISGDSKLRQFCRGVLDECLPGNYEIHFGATPKEAPGPDLTIWDYTPDLMLPASAADPAQESILVVDRKQLPLLRDAFAVQSASILLKPVNHAILRIFIEHAIARQQSPVAQIGNAQEHLLENERDRLFQLLLRANLNLQKYDQDRTNFLARTVHDFRAPLTGLQGYCGLLLEQRLGPLNTDQMELLRGMHRSTKRLARLATALLDLNANHRRDRKPDLREVDLERTIEQAIHEISPFALERQIEIQTELQTPPAPVLFEQSQLEQVLINLLENACKFTPKQGRVAVLGYPVYWDRSASRSTNAEAATAAEWDRSNAYRIDIRDSGPGIVPEHFEDIFEEYTSYSGGKDRSGGGLGLAICKMILDSHDGSIWADSNGDGATFSFVVPCIAEQTHTRQAKVS